MINSEQRRRYFEPVREIHAAGLAGKRLLSSLFGIHISTIEGWLKWEPKPDLAKEARRRLKAGEQIKDVAQALGVHRNTVSRWAKALKVRKLRATERGMHLFNLKLLRQGFTLDQRIKIIDQAVADGFVYPRTKAARFSPDDRKAKIALARELRGEGYGWPIKRIAAHIGISPDTASTWCRGVRCPVNHRPKGNPVWLQREADNGRRKPPGTKGMKICERKDKLFPLVRTLAKTTDLSVGKIAKQVGMPYETCRRWLKPIRRPHMEQTRLPHGAARGLESINDKLLGAGVPASERLKILQEARRAA